MKKIVETIAIIVEGVKYLISIFKKKKNDKV